MNWSCTRNLQFSVNHSFLLNLPKSKIYDAQFLNCFKEIQPQLENILEYYQKYDENSAVVFKKSEVKEYIKNFILKLSPYLNLSCEVCHKLFQSYLSCDGKLDDNDLQSVLARGHNTISLMQKIKKYYHEERLSLIRLIRYAFFDWKEELTILSTIVFRTSKIESKKHIFLKVLNSYKNLINEPHRDKTGFDYRDDNIEDDWIMRSFEEQAELLETMLIGAYSIKGAKDEDLFRQVLAVFKLTGFCLEFNASKVVSSTVHFKNVSDRICIMQALILVELSDVRSMFALKNQSSSHFLANSKLLSELNIAVLKLGSRSAHSVLILFMAVLHNVFHIDQRNPHDSAKLAQTAIVKLNVFRYVDMLLSNKPYSVSSSEGSHLGLIVHGVLFDLMSIMCHNIHLNSLDPSVRHELVTAVCAILRPIMSSSEFQPLNDGFMKMLEDLSLTNLDMLKVIGCLVDKCGVQEDNQPKIVGVVADFLENLSWFCDARSADFVKITNESSDINSTTQCRLISEYQPYFNKPGFTLDQQHEGYLIDNQALWAVHYSAWDVIEAEVEMSYLMLSSDNLSSEFIVGPANVISVNDQLIRLEAILDFLCIALQNEIRLDDVINIFQQLWRLVENDAFLFENCESILAKLISLAGQILAISRDIELVSRIVSIRNLFPNSQASSERIVSNQSIIDYFWKSCPSNITIIKAYLRFNISLINCEKFLDTEIGVIPPSLIFGSIVFVIRSVLDNLPKQINSSDMTDLASDCLIFLNEIMSIKPRSYLMLSDTRKSRLELIQQATHEIIASTPTAVKVILSMSSIEIETLLKHSNLSNQMLTIHGTEERLSRLVWMALTLVKYIFNGPELLIDDPQVRESGAQVLLKILDTNDNESMEPAFNKRRTTMTNSQQYVLRLLEFLTFPYSIKIARMSLDILKLLVQNTDISIVACLGEKSSLIRDTFLRIFASSTEDQIVRANLFNFLSECVMLGRHGVLQLIAQTKPDTIEGGSTTCYRSCVDIIKNFKPDDEMSVKLLCSVSKFLSSLWVKECFSLIDGLKSIDIWSSLLAPTKEFLNMLNNHRHGDSELVIDNHMFEFLGNVYGLFGMELYSSTTLAKSDDNFVKSLEALLGSDLFPAFLSVFDKAILEVRLPQMDKFVKSLLSPITWWKTLLVTALSARPKLGIQGLSSSEEADLVVKTLESVFNLLSISAVVNTPDLNVVLDQLSSSVLEILHKKSKSFTGAQNSSIAKQLVSVLVALLPSHSTVIQIRHADLLASCVMLMSSSFDNFAVQQEMESLAETYLFVLTTRSSLNKLESKTLVQAISLYITIDMATGDAVHPEWLERLADIGVLHNCLVLVCDCIKRNDLSLMTQSLLLLLIRAANTKTGATRIIQSSLLHTLEADFVIHINDHDTIPFLVQLLKLGVVLVTHNGPISHDFGFRLLLSHWDKFNELVTEGCTRIGRLVTTAEDYERIRSLLEIGQAIFDIVFHLLIVRGVWPMYWPASVIARIERLVIICTNTVACVLSNPQTVFVQDSAFIIAGRNKSIKKVSFVANSPKMKLERGTESDNADDSMVNLKMQLASSHLESILYKLLHSVLLVFSRSTYLVDENCIYEGIDYNGQVLIEDFSENSLDKCDQLISFGCLFSIVNATHCLLKDGTTLTIEKEKISFDNDLMRQIHEVAMSIIVSHSVIHLTRFDSANKAAKKAFITNLRSDLGCYLNEFSKNRRRNTISSSSPVIAAPRITSTPYPSKVSAEPDCFDLFCAGIDLFRKSLDLM